MEEKKPEPGTPGGVPKIIDARPIEEDELKRRFQYVKSFQFDHTSEEDGKLYSGVFTMRRLTLGDVGQVEVVKARLSGEQQVHPYIDKMHEMLAYLQFALIKFPDWWRPTEFFDAALLTSVHSHVQAWEGSFRRSMAERRRADQEGSGQESTA